MIWQNGRMEAIGDTLLELLSKDLQENFDRQKWEAIVFNEEIIKGKELTFLPVPEEKKVK
ncbi:hypothetical protein ACRQ5D_34070 [Mucilaginibacter sp. P25]|uniref:hypothetical protein n=1 Tax=Mucilaginibacter sp. P25 TaxID=3423945 RepID=UPI003D7BAB97